jgi:membrane protease YdiL (CAAX protease family)
MSNWSKGINGVLFILLGIFMDFAMQIGASFAQYGVSRGMHVSVNSLLPISAQVAVALLMTFVIVKILLWAIRLVNPKVGFHSFDRKKLNWVWRGYLLILAANLLVGMMRLAFQGANATAANQANLAKIAGSGVAGIVFVTVLAIIVAPLVEELIFRGIVMNYFFKNSGWWINVVLSGLIFGYFHVFQAFSFFDMMQYSAMGIMLAFVYKKTKQIQYAMLVHLLNNSVAIVALVVMTVLH